MEYQGELWYPQDVRTATAGEAIAFKGACVKLSAEKTIVKTTAAADVACGLVIDSYESGKQAEYVQRGKLRFVAGGTIVVNDPLCPDNGTAGRVRKATTAEKVIGRALTGASVGEFAIGEFDFATSNIF